MILSELKAYLQARGHVPLTDIVHHFDVDTEVARNMLQVWVNKGKVQRLQTTPSCGSSCSQCDPGTTEIYVWGAPLEGQQFIHEDCSLH